MTKRMIHKFLRLCIKPLLLGLLFVAMFIVIGRICGASHGDDYVERASIPGFGKGFCQRNALGQWLPHSQVFPEGLPRTPDQIAYRLGIPDRKLEDDNGHCSLGYLAREGEVILVFKGPKNPIPWKLHEIKFVPYLQRMEAVERPTPSEGGRP